MKYLKIIIKYFIIGILCILIIDYIRITIHYQITKKNYQEEYMIYGNKNKYTPQGLSYSVKYNVILQTSYNSKHKVSMLYVTDRKSKKLLKELALKNIDNTENTGHVGGITTDNETVWITNDYEVEEYSLEEIMTTKQTEITAKKRRALSNRGDFCYYYQNILWIGDFFLKPFYPVPNDTPLMMGYIKDEEIDYGNPNYIISLPIMVQGFTLTEDYKFIFTTSFTNLIQSSVIIYQNILNKEPDVYEWNGKSVPYYKITNKDIIKTIQLPPMAEGIFYDKNYLYILFENSSDTYFYAYPKINKIIKMNIKEQIN